MQRQREWYWISYAFVFCLLTQFLVACNNPTPTIVKLDPTTSYTFEGWGTSLAWWAEVVGGWPKGKDTPRDRLENALFTLGDNNHPGLGLNIVRYNFGANTPDYQCSKGFRPGGSIDSFEPADGQWAWGNDSAQVGMLQDAAQAPRGANLFEGFANSAPAWMLTKPNCTKGNGGSDNLNKDMDPVTGASYEQDYAIYLATIFHYFHDHLHIPFHTIDPFNEPRLSWGPNGDQEGMSVSRDQQQRVIQYLYTALHPNGASSDTSISASDDNSIDDTAKHFIQQNDPNYDKNYVYDATTQGEIAQINTHSYNGTLLQELSALSQHNGKPLWMSEFTTDGTDANGHVNKVCAKTTSGSTTDMTGALSLSCRILLDINTMHAQAWVYWQAVEALDNPDCTPSHKAYGLLQVHFCSKNTDYTFNITKQYDAMWQYSHFIRQGYKIIKSGDANSLAAFDYASHTLVIVTSNDDPSNTRDITYDLSNFTPVTEPITAYTTTADTPVNATPQPSPFSASGTQFMAHVPSQSITTYVIHNISVLSSGNPGTTTENPLGKVDWTKAVTETDLGCNAPTGPNHGVEVDEKQFADVTGDGKKEAFVAVACVASTSSWPDRLEVFDGASDPAHPRRIATLLDYKDGTDERGLRIGSNFGIPQSITISGRTITVVSHGYASTDPNCCFSLQITDTFTWNGSGFTRGPRSVVQAKAPWRSFFLPDFGPFPDDGWLSAALPGSPGGVGWLATMRAFLSAVRPSSSSRPALACSPSWLLPSPKGRLSNTF